MLYTGTCFAQQLQGNSAVLYPIASYPDSLLIVPPALSASWKLTLPMDGGTSGQFLQTDGSGVSSWQTVSSGGAIDTIFRNNIGITYTLGLGLFDTTPSTSLATIMQSPSLFFGANSYCTTGSGDDSIRNWRITNVPTSNSASNLNEGELNFDWGNSGIGYVTYISMQPLGMNLNNGANYLINGATVLTTNTLGSGIASSSLTSLGTLTTLKGAITSISTTSVISATAFFIAATGGSGGITLTLPASPASGEIIWVAKVDAGAGSVSVQGNSGQSVYGASLTLATQGASDQFIYEATNIWIAK